MSEMIERVAKAIYESKLFQPARSDDPWDGEATVTKAFCRQAARDAIEAMREPPQMILKAGCIALRTQTAREGLKAAALSTAPHDFSRTKMSLRWNAMIDEALNDENRT